MFQCFDSNTSETKHGMVDPSKARVRTEAVVGLVGQGGGVGGDLAQMLGNIHGVRVRRQVPVRVDHVV